MQIVGAAANGEEAVQRAKRNAQATACLSNLHQIGLALKLYLQDNKVSYAWLSAIDL